MERFRINVVTLWGDLIDPKWQASGGVHRAEAVRATNLLRAICLCVARMQMEKEGKRG